MRSSVLDSYALLAFLFRERGHQTVLDLFEKAADAQQPLFMAAPNWAEVRYRVEQKLGGNQWRATRLKLMGLPLEIVPADQALAEVAGELKATRRMSLADCFAAALTKQRDADFYTGDPEFAAVEREIKIRWL